MSSPHEGNQLKYLSALVAVAVCVMDAEVRTVIESMERSDVDLVKLLGLPYGTWLYCGWVL